MNNTVYTNNVLKLTVIYFIQYNRTRILGAIFKSVLVDFLFSILEKDINHEIYLKIKNSRLHDIFFNVMGNHRNLVVIFMPIHYEDAKSQTPNCNLHL